MMDLPEFIQLVYSSKLSRMKELVENGTNIEITDSFGRTALICACDEGNYEITKYLIENGANINVQTIQGLTPLMYACDRGSYDCIKILLESGADINMKDVEGNNVAFHLDFGLSTKICSLLIEYNTDVNLENNNGLNPLWYSYIHYNWCNLINILSMNPIIDINFIESIKRECLPNSPLYGIIMKHFAGY